MPENFDKSSFAIIDSRIGAGAKTLEIYKNEFNKSEKIWLAYDLKNMTALVEGKEMFFWIREDLSIKDKDGNILTIKPDVINIKSKISEKPLRFINQLDLSSLEIKPGKYSAVVLVTDMAALKTSQETLEFEIIK